MQQTPPLRMMPLPLAVHLFQQQWLSSLYSSLWRKDLCLCHCSYCLQYDRVRTQWWMLQYLGHWWSVFLEVCQRGNWLSDLVLHSTQHDIFLKNSDSSKNSCEKERCIQLFTTSRAASIGCDTLNCTPQEGMTQKCMAKDCLGAGYKSGSIAHPCTGSTSICPTGLLVHCPTQ